MLNISIDLKKLPTDVDQRRLALLDIFYDVAHGVVTLGDHPTTELPITRITGRVGEWQISRLPNTCTVNIPMSWLQPLEKLANREKLTPEQIIVGALGEELARVEKETENENV